jgi:long-chain acyl-CoA synthetase
MLLYTSGTTSRPKGATHTHSSVIAHLELLQEEVPDSENPCLCVLPMMHVAAFTMVAVTLCYGLTLVLLPQFDPAAVLDAIEEFHCYATSCMPALWQFILTEQERAPRRVSSLTLAFAAGDAVP